MGDDGVLVIGPGEAVGLAEVSTRPVLFRHHTQADAPSLAHDGEDADVTFSSVWAADLGGCYVEAVWPGRGATSDGVVFTILGDGVVAVGDLVTSGPPAYGPDSWPLEWPDTLDMVVGLTPAGATVVPAQGEPVDRQYVEDQRQEIVGIAEQVNVLAGQGVRVEQAYDRGEWPFPEDVMRVALARAFEQWRP